MDEQFDEQQASAIINAFMVKHGQTDALPAGGHYVTDDFSSVEFTVQPDVFHTYTVFRLIAEDEDDGDDVTEVTFFVVAVLAQKLFPPFKPRKMYSHNRQTLFATFKQSATLVGANTSCMASAVDTVRAAYVALERHVPNGSPFPTERVNVDNFVVSNPYYIVGDDAKGQAKVEFPRTVDPVDDLKGAQTDSCVHTADNEVQYLEAYDDEHGVERQIPLSPAQFRPGDIVRVGFSVTVKKNNKLHARSELELVMRSVTLLDKTLSTAIAKRKLEEASAPSTKKRSAITRGKFVEDTEERPVAKVRKALAKMSLDSGAMDADAELAPGQPAGAL
ncbi:hypothetical protein K523DRAFT_354597 [Schizophyllum commune Tattone D]|nr:hypothetical protein K523DRAFT_354597 [Schizophyllum commune Tattone D]